MRHPKTESDGRPTEGATGAETAKKKKRQHRQWSGATLGILVALAGLAAGRLGQLYPVFDVFSQMGMQFVLMAVGFALALFVPRYKALTGFAFTAALIAAYGAWPHLVSNGLPKGPYPAAEGEVVFTLAHFNVHDENPDIAAVAKEIGRLNADVVSLVEFMPSKLPIFDMLAQQYPYRHNFAVPGGENFAMLSRFPILEPASRGMWEGPPFATAKLGGPLEGVRLYSVHTTRFPHFRAHLRQIRAMVRELSPQGGPMVLAGDFNATPFSRMPGLIEDGLNMRRITHLPTWPAQTGLPQLAIDHVFIGDGLRVVAEQQIGDNAGSDHYPIIMTLAFKPR